MVDLQLNDSKQHLFPPEESNGSNLFVEEDYTDDYAKGSSLENASGLPTKCEVCNNEFGNPVVLNCLHIFDHDCLKKFESNQDDELFSTVKCPKCDTISGGLSTLEPFYMDVLECSQLENNKDSSVSSDNSTENAVLCTLCTADAVAEYKCNDCASPLCEGCRNVHKVMKMFSSHSVTDLSEEEKKNIQLLNLKMQQMKPVMCCYHKSQAYKFFCFQCHIPICEECAASDHKQHIDCPLEDVPEKLQEVVKTFVTDCQKNQTKLREVQEQLNQMLMDLTTSRDQNRSHIEEVCNDWKQAIDEIKEEFLKTNKEYHDTLEIKVMENVNLADKTIDHIDYAMEFTQCYVDKCSPVQMSKIVKTVVSCLEQMSKTEVSSDNIRIGVHFHDDKARVKDILRREFGWFGGDAVMPNTQAASNGLLQSSNNVAFMSMEGPGSDILSGGHHDNWMNGFPQTSSMMQVSAHGPGGDGRHSTSPPYLTLNHQMSSSSNITSVPTSMPPPSGHHHLPHHSGASQTNIQSALAANPMLAPGSHLRRSGSVTAESPTDSISGSGVVFNSDVLRNNSIKPMSDFMPSNANSGYSMLSGKSLTLDTLPSATGMPTHPSSLNGSTPRTTTPAGLDPNNPGSVLPTNLLDIIERSSGSGPSSGPGLPGSTGSGLLSPVSSNNNGEPLAKPGSHVGYNPNPNPPFPNRAGRCNIMNVRYRWGSLGAAREQLSSPHGFCLGFDEDIVVADTQNHRIQIFTKTGEFREQFGVPGREEGQLWYPRKVATLRASQKYVVCDRGNERSRMQIFTRSGHFIKKIVIRYIDIVAGLAINAYGHIVAVDSVSPTVFVISENGDLVKWFDCSDYMKEPSDIAISGRDYYICDFKGHCVAVFQEDGTFLRRIGSEAVTNFPNGIDVSDHGDVLIGDSHGNRFHISVFSRQGSLLSEFECPTVKVSRCCGLKITSEGYVVTLAKNNHHVLVLDTLYVT